MAVNLHVVNLLRITNFYVPRRAYNQVEIDCKYDVEGKKLYDVKWYKDGDQFFRCTGDGTVYEFPVDGVTIRHSESSSVGACPLTLIVLSNKTSGEYKCEITLDTEGFPTEWRSSRLDFLLSTKKTDNPDMVPKGNQLFRFTIQFQSCNDCIHCILIHCSVRCFWYKYIIPTSLGHNI